YLADSFFERLEIDAVCWACRGGGKTFVGAVATALDMCFKPGIQIRILAGSRYQAGHMYRALVDLLDRLGLDVEARRERVRHEDAVTEILSQSERAVRGTRVHKLRCDEVELFHPDVWESAQLVTKSERLGDTWVHGTIDAFSTHHRPSGIMKDLLDDASEGRRACHRWTIADCLGPCSCRDDPDCPLRPWCERSDHLGHIHTADALAMQRRVSKETWQAEMACDRPMHRHAVFPEFDETRHVGDTDERGTRCAGIDFGIRAPTVILLASIEGDRIHIIDEFVRSDHAIERYIAYLEAARVRWIGADPAGRARELVSGISPVAALRARGLQVRTRPSRIEDGIRHLKSLLDPAAGEPTLRIHPRCTTLITAFRHYHYDTENTATPAKDGFDHPIDALRYLVTNMLPTTTFQST
ncbi:MAG: hypothetical protein KDA28_06470, partial [Phycisphaerales bacterium]|nr:hypothetical protein [Phycisphaerales bacterium]